MQAWVDVFTGMRACGHAWVRMHMGASGLRRALAS